MLSCHFVELCSNKISLDFASRHPLMRGAFEDASTMRPRLASRPELAIGMLNLE